MVCKRRLMLVLVALVGIIGIAAISIKKSQEIRKAIYVVPNNFRGLAVIKMNQPNGVMLPVKDGVVRILFPRNGILEIKGDDPMMSYSEKAAIWESGLPLAFVDENFNASEIRLNHLGYFHDKTESWYFVGTGNEAEAYLISVESQMK